MAKLRLPQRDELKAFGGRPCFAPLLDIRNFTDVALRLEARVGDMEAWQVLVPSVAPESAWAALRTTPLWIPRVASVRLVNNATDHEVLVRSPWAEGGELEVKTEASGQRGT